MATRRSWIVGSVGLVGAGALVWANRNTLTRKLLQSRSHSELSLTTNDAASCTLSPQQTDGPFFVRSPLRQNIVEDRSGLALTLDLSVTTAGACTPIAGATVEIWHCDAAGRYSAYPEDFTRAPFDTFRLLADADDTGHLPPNRESRYLRGAQVSGADGRVRFQTILPGWYDPRVPHIHVKVFDGQRALYATQLYFPEALTDRVYADHPDYAPHGKSAYRHSNDPVLGTYPDAEGLLLSPVEGRAGLEASARLVLA